MFNLCVEVVPNISTSDYFFLYFGKASAVICTVYALVFAAIKTSENKND